MSTYYTDEVNVQTLIALMKHHGVRRVVASPGTTNITFVASIQQDPFFKVYSSVDERSAAYIACGMAAETGESVALSCTGATASRNYLSGLTEAYYRKLPVLAVTATQHLGRIGHMVPQVIDRTSKLNDACRMSVQCLSVHDDDDRWACEASLNRALLELTRDGGGPVHVNLVTTYSSNFDVPALPSVHPVDRVEVGDELPSLAGKKAVVYVGAHRVWDERLTAAVDAFCAAYDAVVLYDHTSNYVGAYGILGSLVLTQTHYVPSCKLVDVLIHIGDVSGACGGPIARECWRVNPDGNACDPFGKLRYVFGMREIEFFEAYASVVEGSTTTLNSRQLNEWRSEDAKLRKKIPLLPFSNIWCAQQMAPMLPADSVLHLGILNSLRSWDFFPVDASIRCYCNTGGFGIDGCVSSLIGASLAAPDKLFFGVVGDLATFYDLNSLGNRHVGCNIRLMVINNGVGTEFKNYNHKAARFGTDADAFIAARGHFGNRSTKLLRHYVEDLGFEYMSAFSKEELLQVSTRFMVPKMTEHPMLLEVFTDSANESDALQAMLTLESNVMGTAKELVHGVIGDRGVNTIKKILGR